MLNLLLVVAGVAAILGVEVRELPRAERDIVTVSAETRGWAPELIDSEVTAVLERALARVPGIAQLDAKSSLGRARVRAVLDPSADPEAVMSRMRDAVARVRRDLPEEVGEPRIVRSDPDAEPFLKLALTSDRLDSRALTRLAEEVILDRLAAIDGVADFKLPGRLTEALRIEMDPLRLTALGLVPGDLQRALAAAQIELPGGLARDGAQEWAVRATAGLPDLAAIGALDLGRGLRLEDVADVAVGPAPQDGVWRVNGAAGIGIELIRQADANVLATSAAVRDVVAAINAELPPGTTLAVTVDEADFVAGAMAEVVKTLGLAALIVATVIWLFLGDLRTSLVPAVAIPIALVGSLAAVWMLGYSINVLTLLALVLATGLVVDDAIVVLEAIKRRHAEGMAPLQAAAEGTSDVVFPVLATTAVLGAVFAPLAFLPGEIGMVLREFAITLAVAAALSTLVALTLAPVLAARVLRAAPAEPRARGPLARAGAALVRGYGIVVAWITAAPWVVLLGGAGVTAASLVALSDLKRGFLPVEDRGEVRVYVTLPPGSPLDLTETRMREVEARLAPLLASGEAVALMVEVGAGGRAERGHATLALAPHGTRRPQAEILTEIGDRLEGLTGATIRTGIKGGLKLGAGAGGADHLSLAVLADTHEAGADMAARLADRLAADPAFDRIAVDHDPSEPQIVIEIDPDKARRFGVDPAAIGSVLRAASDGQSLGTVMLGGQVLPAVLLPPQGRGIGGPGSLGLVLLPAAQGHAVTLAELAEITERRGARELVRVEGRAAVQIDARPAPGSDPAGALTRARALAAELLPQDMRLVLVGATADMQRSDRSLMLAAGFALLLVFMVLAAQFESLRAATAIMATVPLGLALVALGLVAAGIEFNLYAQIGTLLLVGLLAKNAILIVDAAEVKLAQGLGARQAVTAAAVQRFRPVMMTLVSTMLGALPLALAEGPGAEARVSVGLVVVGGLGLSALATLVLTPATWLVLSRRAARGPGQSAPRAA